mgnify:CR=1 FL=1
MADRLEAVVIGSGFGGAITACRMAKKWPGQVMVLERGKRYPMGSFPRSPHDTAKNFWNVPYERRKRPKAVKKASDESHGLFDIRNFKKMDAVICAGLGGGSLIYANVFLEPPDEVFNERWPGDLKKNDLLPYYKIAKEVLGSRPIPQNADPRRRVVRTEMFQEAAKQAGRNSRLLDLNVFFGNDFANPTPIGYQEKNRYGAVQTSCVYCAECDVGCNTHSKNTLDLNYLYRAEHEYGAHIRTEHLVEKIVPLDERGEESAEADGSHGYRVHYRDLNGGGESAVDTRRVMVSAGTLGSSEMLLRCRDVFKTLPRLSPMLGHHFSGNGDFLSFVMGTQAAADPNYGPVITQATDFNLFDGFDRSRAFLVEDASYPSYVAWFVEGIKPGYLRLGAVWYTLKSVVSRWLKGDTSGSVGYALGDLLKGDLSYTTAVLLCMGVDTGNGTLTLDKNGFVELDWPQKENMPLYEAIVDAGEAFEKATGADKFFTLPTWWRPFRNNVTVHCLGGCVLGNTPEEGVVSAERATFGQAFGYKNLYVADGAIVPTAVGANPTATISALSEMVGEGITGIAPDARL